MDYVMIFSRHFNDQRGLSADGTIEEIYIDTGIKIPGQKLCALGREVGGTVEIS